MSGRKINYNRELNEILNDIYDLRSTIKRELRNEDTSIACVIGYTAAVGSIIGCLIGATAGLVLSFIALSPLVIGGMIGSVFPASLALMDVGIRYWFSDDINELKKSRTYGKIQHANY